MPLHNLSDRFHPADLEWLIVRTNEERTSALVVPYVRREAIMDRLDSAVGPENWRVHFAPGAHGGVLCTLEIRCDGEWVAKQDGAENTDVQPVKGGISAAFKRAATQWGIGRYLANAEKVWTKARPIGKKGAEIVQLPSMDRVFPQDDDRTPVSRMADATERHPSDELGAITQSDWGPILSELNRPRGLTMVDYARYFQISNPDSQDGKREAVAAITSRLQAHMSIDGVTLEQACEDLRDAVAGMSEAPPDDMPADYAEAAPTQ